MSDNPHVQEVAEGAKVAVFDPIRPPLMYPIESLPPDVQAVIKEARLMPYVEKQKNGKYLVGYSYHQVKAVRGVSHLNYIRRAVTAGKIRVTGQCHNRLDSENEVMMTLLDVGDVHKWKYRRNDDDRNVRTYELKADGPAWAEIREFIDKMNEDGEEVDDYTEVEYKDKTEERRLNNQRRNASK